MNWKTDYKYLLSIVTIFIGCYFLHTGTARSDNCVLEVFHVVK